jgi:hypothetical protein
MKKILKGRHFDDIYDIRSNAMAALKAFHKTSSKIVLAMVLVHSFPRRVL